MPRKVFVAGEILTAADVNTNLMDQAVMVFDDSAARTTAIPTPSEGMVTYLKDTDSLEQFTGAAFVPVSQPGILQVVSTTKTDTFSTSSSTYVDITGLTATITPQSATSKILVTVEIPLIDSSDDFQGDLQLLRDATVVTEAAAGATSTAEAWFAYGGLSGTPGGNRLKTSTSLSFLDSPSSSSALVYKLRTKKRGGGAMFMNRWVLNTDVASVSTITLMEVAG